MKLNKKNTSYKNNNYKNDNYKNDKRDIINNYKVFIKRNPQILPSKNIQIVEYMKKMYIPFVEEKQEKSKEGMDVINFNDVFLASPKLFTPKKIESINVKLSQNPNMSLYKLISYSLFSKSFNYFDSKPNNIGQLNMESFKYQVGKDLSRVDINVNSIPLPKGIKVVLQNYTTDNYKTTDNFNLYIMSIMKSNGIPINLNTIIILDAILCQDIFNTVSDLIIGFIADKIKPEIVGDTKVNKSVNIILTKKEQYIIFHYNCEILISYQGILDPEFTCGNYSFILKLDIKNNTYLLELKLNYNVNNCIPSNPIQFTTFNNFINGNGNQNDEPSSENKLNMYKQDAYKFIDNNKPEIIAGLATTGLASVGALFLSGILGGKRKTTKYKGMTKKLKTRKKIKKKRFS